jgi:hypothetical protein
MLDKRSLAHAPRTLDNYILTILGEFLELTLKFRPRAKVFPGNDASIFKRVHARNYTKNALRKSSLKIAHSCAAQNPALHLLFSLNKAVGIARRVRVGQFQLPYDLSAA